MVTAEQYDRMVSEYIDMCEAHHNAEDGAAKEILGETLNDMRELLNNTRRQVFSDLSPRV